MERSQFVITDGNRFVKQNMNGKYNMTSNYIIADSWDTPEKAESVLYNSVPPNMRFNLYISELKDGVIEGQETISRKEVVDCRKQVLEEQKDVSYELSKYSFDDDEDVQKMIKGFEDVRNTLGTYAKDSLFRQLGEKTMYMNFVVEDIKHYHGKKALNARDGFKLNKLEDKAIIKRISVKNQLEISRQLTKHYSAIYSHIEEICKTIDDLRNLKYKPRALIDLFENDNLDIDF